MRACSKQNRGWLLAAFLVLGLLELEARATSVDNPPSYTAASPYNFAPPDVGAGGSNPVNAYPWIFTAPTSSHYTGLTTYGLSFWDTLFSVTHWDPTIGLGYNEALGGGRAVATEPYLAWDLETKYYDGAKDNVEFYLQYQPDNTTSSVVKRPIFWQFHRSAPNIGSFNLRNDGITLQNWWANGDCTASVAPWACCTGAGTGSCDSTDQNYGTLSATGLTLSGKLGQAVDTAFVITAQNSHDAYTQYANTAGKSAIFGAANATGPYIQGTAGSTLSLNSLSVVSQTNGIYKVLEADAGAVDPRYSFDDSGTVANTTSDGHVRGSWYGHYTVSGGTKFGTFYGGYFLPTDATSLANTHKGYRCYLGSVTGASTTSSCLDLDAQSGVGGTHSLGTLANGTLSMTAAPFAWNTTPATAGDVRFPNNEDGACWRNAANSANLCLKADGSNTLLFNGSPVGGGSGDVTDVGPGCATGACFTNGVATTGSVLLDWEGTTVNANDFVMNVPADPSAAISWTVPDAAAAVTFFSGTDTVAGKATADIFTNKTLDAEGTGNVITIPVKIWTPTATCSNTQASANFDVTSTTAPLANCEGGTNNKGATLDFDDTTAECVQSSVLLPSDWSGAIDAIYVWKAAATSGAVGWCSQFICTADAETDDNAFPAFSSSLCVSDTAKGTTLQLNTAADTGITATGCAAGELMRWRLCRDAASVAVTDSMAGDAKLVGVELTMRRAM